MIIKTEDEFKIEGSREEIVNDVFEVFLAFAKKSEDDIFVYQLAKDLDDLISKKVNEQIEADIEKLYKNSKYGLLDGVKQGLAMIGDIKLKTIFNNELDHILTCLNENANPKYSFHILTDDDEADELDIMMHLGDAIMLNFTYTRADCQLNKVIIKEINWHLHQISCHDRDYYKGCDEEYLQGYWKDLLTGIKDILVKM